MPCTNSDLAAEIKDGIERLPSSRAEHVLRIIKDLLEP